MGQKVVCIKDDGYDIVHQIWIKKYPVKGERYHVRKRVHTKFGLGLLLEEIINPVMPNGVEPNFSAKRFKFIDDSEDLVNALVESEKTSE